MKIEYMTTDMTSDAEDDGRVTIEYDEFLMLMTHMILKIISNAEDEGSGTIEYDEFLRTTPAAPATVTRPAPENDASNTRKQAKLDNNQVVHADDEAAALVVDNGSKTMTITTGSSYLNAPAAQESAEPCRSVLQAPGEALASHHPGQQWKTVQMMD